MHSTDGPVTQGPGRQVLARATKILQQDPRIAEVVQPQPGATLSKDGTTAVILAGAGADTNEMVRAATDLKGPLQGLYHDRRAGQPDRRLAALVGLQRGQPQRDAEVGDVLLAGDPRDPVLAFGALVGAPGCR